MRYSRLAASNDSSRVQRSLPDLNLHTRTFQSEEVRANCSPSGESSRAKGWMLERCFGRQKRSESSLREKVRGGLEGKEKVEASQ